MQDQLVCHGCGNMLMYPRGATIVRCALCNTINLVSHAPQGMEMAHIRSGCGHCGSVMMHTRGATSVRCSSCQILNLVAVPHNQTAHINCGHCRITLMYPYGAPSVKCGVCQFVTNVNMNNGRVSPLINRPNGTVTQPTMPSTSITTQTVVVENPMSVDESGKLVSNVVVGVTTHKK